MKKARITEIGLVIICAMSSCVDLTNKKSAIDHKVDSLLSKMTLAEKVGQTNLYNGTWEFTGPVPDDEDSKSKAEKIKNGQVGGMLNVLTAKGTYEAQKMAVENSRLKIPLIFGYDVIHGYQTMLPVPIAQAASWDAEAASLSAQIAAREAAASGVHWTFAPMIDISRDARWGRIMEGAGEDPYLSSVMAKAWVNGFQGEDLSATTTIAACAKHFAAYGFSESGRDYNTVDISNETLFNVVLPPFKAAKDAGVASFMNSFNVLGGVPATGNEFLQRTILKDGWDYDGLVVSDWGSVAEMITHGYAKDLKDAAKLALIAGCDMDMESRAYEQALEKLILNGQLDESLLNDAVRRILRLKFKLGLFDDPYRYCDEKREKEEVLSKKNLEDARDIAHKTFVLLKNESNILPLTEKTKSIAVIGQLANSKDIPLGNWRGKAIQNSAVSLLEGIQNAVDENVNIRFAEGYTLTRGTRDFIHELEIVDKDESGFAKAIEIAKTSDVVVIAMGEDCFQTGEGRSQSDIGLKGSQVKLLSELKKVNNNIIVVLMTGRPVAIPEVAKDASAILETWYAGSESGNAIADVLFGKFNPSGKLPVSFPYSTGQEPLYYSVKNTGRPQTNDFDKGLVFWSHYTDGSKEALFSFGHGLSYTNFTYDKLQVTVNKTGVEISAEVSNSGNYDGDEVVQLYIRDMVASITRPILELKGFKKVRIQKGTTDNIKFELTKDDLSFYNHQGKKIFEPGEFEISLGTSSNNRIKQIIEIK